MIPSPGGLLLTGTGWITLSHAATKLALLVTVIVGARVLDVDTFGFVMSLYSVVLIASVVWNLGTAGMASRDVAAGELSLVLATRMIFRSRLSALPLWVAVITLGVLTIGMDQADAGWAVAVLCLVSISHNASMVAEGLLHGQLRFKRSAIALASGRTMQLLAIAPLMAVFDERPLVGLASILALGEVTTALLLWRALRSCPDPNPGADRHHVSASVRATLTRSAPYALSGFFKLGYGKADLILVTALAGAFQAGLYAPATRLQDALLIIPAVAVGTMIPLSARATKDDSGEASSALFWRGLRLSFGLSAVGAMAIYLLLPWLLPVVLGSEFTDAVTPARILIWSIPFAAIQATILSTLIGHGRAKAASLMHGVALATTIIGHLLLDGRYGAVGGAWASLSREPLSLIVGSVLLRRTWTLTGRSERQPRSTGAETGV